MKCAWLQVSPTRRVAVEAGVACVLLGTDWPWSCAVFRRVGGVWRLVHICTTATKEFAVYMATEWDTTQMDVPIETAKLRSMLHHADHPPGDT